MAMSERTMNWNKWTELEVFDDDYYDKKEKK